MARACLASLVATGLLIAATPALAQTAPTGAAGPMDSDQAMAEASAGGTPTTVTTTTTASTTPVRSSAAADAERANQLLDFQGQEYGLGWRQWFLGIPSGIVGAFVHVEPGWPGSFVGSAMGPEFTYRNHGFEIDLAGMYVNYNSPAGIFRAATDPDTSSERVQSGLWGLFITAHFMASIHLHRMFEIQIGGGIGLGYLGGSLYRTEVYPTGTNDANGNRVWGECTGLGAPNTQYCNNTPGHYSNNGPNGGRYVEPNWFGGGSVPAILPWLSIPQVAFHLRPHRNFDVKLEVGFGLIDIYGGLSAHYIF